MQESLPSEHGCELFRNSFEDFLNGCRVSDESGAHRQVSGRNVANGSLDVVRDPFNKEPVTKINKNSKITSLTTVTIRLPDYIKTDGSRHWLGRLYHDRGDPNGPLLNWRLQTTIWTRQVYNLFQWPVEQVHYFRGCKSYRTRTIFGSPLYSNTGLVNGF